MRVFLVDDRTWLRSALRSMLEQVANVEVIGEFGKADCLSHSVEVLHPDLVLFDWDLPGLSTIHDRNRLITTLRAAHPQLYVIVLYGDAAEPCLGLAIGADAFVSTTEPPARLLEALDRAKQASRVGPVTRAGIARSPGQKTVLSVY